MDVAEQIAVINDGRIEQVGQPRDLYEQPASEFVMSFIGPVNRVGDSFIRPHDLDILLEPRGDNSQEAMVERVVHLGFEVRVELTLQNGEQVWAQITRMQAEELELDKAGIVYVRPARKKTFENGRPRTEELQAI